MAYDSLYEITPKVVDVEIQTEGSNVVFRDKFADGTISNLKSLPWKCSSPEHAELVACIMDDTELFCLMAMGKITEATLDKAAAELRRKREAGEL